MQLLLQREAEGVYSLCLCDESTKNALGSEFWSGFPAQLASVPTEAKLLLIYGANGTFSSGLNCKNSALFVVRYLRQMLSGDGDLPSMLRSAIEKMQSAVSALEKCNFVTVACIEGACVGAAIELALACDFCYCTKNAKFSIKETELGFAADLGLLQRGAKKLTSGLLSELALGAAWFGAEKAKELRLVNEVFEGWGEMKFNCCSHQIVNMPLEGIAATKQHLLYARDHSVQDSLEFSKLVNAQTLPQNKRLTSAL